MNRLTGFAIGLAGMIVFGASAQAATQKLVILHDNDIHGHLRSFCYIEVAKGPDEHCDIGGAARRATLLRKLRATAKAPVLLIDSGDTSTRGPLITEYEGLDEVAAMNAMRYDMAAIGNNEFKLKDAADAKDATGAQAALARLVKQSHFTWLCANATNANGALLPGVKAFIVRRIGRLRIAFLGLTAPRSSTYPQTKGLQITDPVAAAKLWIPRARAKADVLIIVSHIGVDDDRKLVQQTRGIDAVVGGDSHTYLYEPVAEKNLDGVTVPIVQDGEFGVRLGEFDLAFEGNRKTGWHLAQSTDQLITVDSTLKPDSTLEVIVQDFARPLDVQVGTLAAVGSTPAERTRMTADTLAQAWKAQGQADVGIQPELSLFDSFRRTDVTRYEVRAVVPFHDTLWRGDVLGKKLKGIVAFPGMHATIAVADIDETKTYSVATTDFVAQAVIPGGTDTGLDARTAFEAWLKSR